MKKLICFVFLMSLVSGCGGSQQKAQDSFDKGSKVNDEVRNAFFVKGWGLNRGLITESRKKFLAQSQVAMLKADKGGKLNADTVEDILKNFEQELGQDEIVTSENFAYLSFLMQMGNRADSMLDNVDTFVESKKPIWRQLLGEAKIGKSSLEEEYKEWEPLIRKIGDHLKQYSKYFNDQKTKSSPATTGS